MRPWRVGSSLTDDWRQSRAWAIALLLTGSAFWATRQLAAHAIASPLTAYLTAFVCVITSVLLVALSVPRSTRICSASVIAAVALIANSQRSAASQVAAGVSVLLALLIAGTVVGSLIGRRVKQAGHLSFVALVSGLADTWSVTQPSGISHMIVNEPTALSLLALPWPLPGTEDIAPLLGVGDVVFVALYIAATRAHALPMRRTLLGLSAGFALSTCCVVLLERPIPVLPWLGICFVLAQPQARRIAAEDLRRGAWVLTVLAGVIAAWFLRRSL
ncbi:MAG: hypothetical protein RL701_6470 [Pseudomonadota bacterium]